MIGSGAGRRHRLGATTATLIVLGVVACEDPQPPTACGPLPQLTVNAGDQATVSACFNDPSGDMLVYSATSANPAVATVSVAGSTVSVAAVAKGTTTVRVTATDPGGLAATQTFRVTVPNRPPAPVGTIPEQNVATGEAVAINIVAAVVEIDGPGGVVGRAGRAGYATQAIQANVERLDRGHGLSTAELREIAENAVHVPSHLPAFSRVVGTASGEVWPTYSRNRRGAVRLVLGCARQE